MDSGRISWALNRDVTWLMSLVLMLVAVNVIIGWWLQLHWMVSILPAFPSMKANTALGLFLLGLGLFLLQKNTSKAETYSKICAQLVIALGVLNLFQYLLNVDLAIDQLLAIDPWSEVFPGRMSFATAYSLVSSGVLLFGLPAWSDKYPKLYDIVISVTAVTPIVALLTYFYNPKDLSANWIFSTMAVHTAVSFLIYQVGLLPLLPASSVLSVFSSQSTGSYRFRAQLIPLLLLPLAMGALIRLAVSNQWLSPGAGISLGISLFAFLSIMFLIRFARATDRVEKILEQEHQQRQSLEEHMLSLMDLSGDALLLFSQNGRVLHANKGAERIFGWSSDELKRMNLSDLIPRSYRERHQQLVKDFLSKQEATTTNINPLKMIALNKLGQEVRINITITKKEFNHQMMTVAIVRDATALYLEMTSMRKAMYYDALTGAENRRAFEVAKNDYIGGERERDTMAILMIDLDNFKSVNDQYGHQVGDKVLKSVTHYCIRCLRQPDRLFRLGGEEFLIAARGVTLTQAMKLAERIREQVTKITILPDDNPYGDAVKVTVSIGLAFVGPDEVHMEHAVGRADEALYDAKQQGRNKVVLWTSGNEIQNSAG